MKQLIITLFIAIVAVTAQAQTTPAEKADTLIIPHSKAIKLQAILAFSFQWLPKSDAPAKDEGQIVAAIQEVYPALWPLPSAPVQKAPKTDLNNKKGKKINEQ